MLGGAMEGGLKRKRDRGRAVEPILPVAPAPKRWGSQAPAKCLNANLFAEGVPGDYLKEMTSALLFSEYAIQDQDARGPATAPPPTTYPFADKCWEGVVPNNVDQKVKKRPAKTVTEKPPPTQPGPESGHKKEKDKPPTGKKRGVSGQFWDQPTVHGWLKSEGLTSQRQLDAHSKREGGLPAGMPAQPAAFFQRRRTTTLTSAEFWDPPPKAEFWDQPTVQGWLKSEGLTNQRQLDAHSKREGGLPAGMPAYPVAFFQRRRTTTLTSAEFWKR